MSQGNYESGKELHDLLSGSRDLVKRVHHDQRSTWFPLMIFAFINFISIFVARFGHRTLGACGSFATSNTSGTVCRVYTVSGLIYWPIALVLAYVAIAVLYLRRSRARGVETGVQNYAIVGIAFAVLVTGASLLTAGISVGEHVILGIHLQESSLGIFFRLLSPACSIGLALLVLARLERSTSLLVLDLFYLVIVLAPVNFGWTIRDPHWAFVPIRVIDGGILLLGGIAFALVQLRSRKGGE